MISRAGVKTCGWASVALVAALTMGMGAPLAQAAPRSVTVNTGADDLNVRAAPSAKSAKVGSIPDGSRVVIVCHTRGDVFSGGPYRLTTDLWNRLDTGGFVTDAMLVTGSDDAVVPRCEGEPPRSAATARAAGKTSAINREKPGTPAWAALAKWHQVSNKRTYPAVSGPPRDWAASARAAGWTVVSSPEPRAIVVFAPGVDGAPATGHVAWVDTATARDGRQFLGITEVHKTGDGLLVWSSRQVEHARGMSYILLP